MQRFNIDDLKKRLRSVFRDDHKIQWSDSLMDEIIFEAQREYSLYSGELLGTADIVSQENSVINCPDDFIKIVRVVDKFGRDFPVVSYKRLASEYGDFRKVPGDERALCLVFDFDSHGRYRIFPKIKPGKYVGKMYYQRLPKENTSEIKNIDAVEAFALYMMFLFTGKDQAQAYYDRFMKLVNKDIASPYRAGNSFSVRSGRFY